MNCPGVDPLGQVPRIVNYGDHHFEVRIRRGLHQGLLLLPSFQLVYLS